MRDLKDLKRDEEGSGPKKKPPYLMIGLLGTLVFLTLVFVFRKKGETPAPPVAPPASQLAPEQPPAPPKEPAEKEETAPQDPALKPGEMRFDSKPDPFPAAPPPPAPKSSSTAQPPGNPAPKEDLTFFKTLKDKKEKSVALQPKKEPKPIAQKTKRPAEKSADSVKVSVPPAAESSGPYTIQVASFSEKKGAETLSQKLKQKGYQAYVTTGEVPQKGTRYRVRIGHYPNRAEAQKAAEQIHESEKLSFLVTSD